MLLTLFSFTLLLSPLYVLESGLPQPFHALGLLLILGNAFRPKFRWFGDVVNPFAGFAVYASLVNLLIYVRYMDMHTLLSATYYIFNIGLFWAAQNTLINHPKAALNRAKQIFLVLLVLELILLILGKGRYYAGVRFTGTLNDPNQLAHWTLWALIGIIATEYAIRRQLGSSTLMALLLGGGVLLATASRSGLLGFLIILAAVSLVYVKGLVRPRILFKFMAMGLGLGLIGSVVLTGLSLGLAGNEATQWSNEAINQAQFYMDRIKEGILKGTGNLEERGYDRLWKYPEYLILGAGEGANDRWAEKSSFLGEIHSSLAGVAFYYGIPGTTLLLIGLIRVWRTLPYFWMRLLLLAPLVYSVGTYNLRNTHFWIGLAVVWSVGVLLRRVSPQYPKPASQTSSKGIQL